MTDKLEYELVEYNCQDGPCLMLREDTTDTKIGALSFDHKSIGEAIVDELNKLAKELYMEKNRTRPILLENHLSDKDFEKLKNMLIKHLGGSNMKTDGNYYYRTMMSGGYVIFNKGNNMAPDVVCNKLTQQAKDIEQLKSILKDAENEIERLKKSNKGLLESIVENDSYREEMIIEILSNLKKSGFCEGCKNKDKPVEWYMERGFSITAGSCDCYEPEN